MPGSTKNAKFFCSHCGSHNTTEVPNENEATRFIADDCETSIEWYTSTVTIKCMNVRN